MSSRYAKTFFSIEKTLADDGAHPIVDYDVFFEEINLHCQTNSINYGNALIQDAVMPVGSFASFKNGNLKEIYIRNTGAGSNGKVVAVCTLKGVLQ